MMRGPRRSELSPAEVRFRMAEWVTANLVVYDRSGPEWTCQCPMCGREKLAVHVGRKAWQCWVCGFRGWAPTTLVMAAQGVAFEDAISVVVSWAQGTDLSQVPALAPRTTMRSLAKLPEATFPPGMSWELRPTQERYAASRGISPVYQRAFGLASVLGDGTGSKADKALRGRLLFPVWAPNGKIVYWIARDVTGSSKAKTINMPRSCSDEAHEKWCCCQHEEWGLPPVPEVASRSEVVLGAHLVRRGDPVYVVEGPVDAAVCGPGFVAVLGSSMSPLQAAQIAATGASEAVLLFDGDDAGAKATAQASALLRRLLPVRVAQLPIGEDPGSLGRYSCLQIAKAAERIGDVGGLADPQLAAPEAVGIRPIAGLADF